MAQMPITVARREYIDGIINLTNNSGLPAFVKVDVLERILAELRPLVENELKRDEASWRAARKAESDKSEEVRKGDPDNGGQEDQ